MRVRLQNLRERALRSHRDTIGGGSIGGLGRSLMQQVGREGARHRRGARGGCHAGLRHRAPGGAQERGRQHGGGRRQAGGRRRPCASTLRRERPQLLTMRAMCCHDCVTRFCNGPCSCLQPPETPVPMLLTAWPVRWCCAF